MAKVEIRLDHSGIAEILKSGEVVALVAGFAAKVAATVKGSVPAGTEIGIDHYVTDRAAAAVVIKDPLGKLYQVRDGVLTKAAAAHGAEVKAR